MPDFPKYILCHGMSHVATVFSFLFFYVAVYFLIVLPYNFLFSSVPLSSVSARTSFYLLYLLKDLEYCFGQRRYFFIGSFIV